MPVFHRVCDPSGAPEPACDDGVAAVPDGHDAWAGAPVCNAGAGAPVCTGAAAPVCTGAAAAAHDGGGDDDDNRRKKAAHRLPAGSKSLHEE